MYCEDSLASQVEHFKPKDFYPELAFVWHNYLYACGPCNVRKTNNFPIVSDRTGELIFLHRAPGDPVEPPEPGRAVLIDPRQEEPLDYMQLDLRETHRFQPLDSDPRSLRHQRARKTIDVLGLNDRDFLPEARGTAYQAYHGVFKLYVDRREQRDPRERLDRAENALRRLGHATVWEEMKRQRQNLPELQSLFERAPEALTW